MVKMISEVTGRQRHCGYRCGTAPDVGGPALQIQPSPLVDFFGRIGHDGLRLSRSNGCRTWPVPIAMWSVSPAMADFRCLSYELATAVEYKIPVKIALMNNNCLGMVRQWQQLFYDNRYQLLCFWFQQSRFC
jgi:hypothetical protein